MLLKLMVRVGHYIVNIILKSVAVVMLRSESLLVGQIGLSEEVV